ncbi:PmbA/TldA family metallopeptidase, partial [Chloroflexota bacterium]
MENILARAKKVAEEAEVFMVSSEETPVQFEANRLKHMQSKQSTSVALRIVRQGKTGYATATELNNSQELVEAAVETAQFGMTAKFDFPTLTVYPQVEVFDPAIESISTEEMAKLGEELIITVRAHTPELVCEAAVAKDTVSVSIINSRGGQANYKQSIFSLGIEGQLIHDTDMLFVGESQSSCHPILDPDTVTKAVLQQLELAKNQAPISTKSLPVVFTPNGIASGLLMPLMAA